jgi:dipicolinate synthase subunit A
LKEIHSFLVAGGDLRQVYLARYLRARGFAATLYGFAALPGHEDLKCGLERLPLAAAHCDAVVLPLPASRDGVTVNACYQEPMENLEALSGCLRRGQPVFAGMMTDAWKSNFFKKGVPVYDYFEREELIVSNAIPTAEGVLRLVMDRLPATVHGSSCVITGYGRTAKVLARALQGLRATVTIAARRCADLAWAASEGFAAVPLGSLAASLPPCQFFVNTVPTLVVDEAILRGLPQDCLVIDIASPPYGIDFAAAAELGLQTVVCGSLPGKTAPKTAGHIIGEAILNIIRESQG